MNTTKGVSSILLVGLVLALSAGLFGLWYLNKMEAAKNAGMEKTVTQAEAPESTMTATPTPVVDLSVDNISTDPGTTEADLDKLEVQMKSLDSSMDDSELNDLN